MSLEQLTKERTKIFIEQMIAMSAQLKGDYWTAENYLSDLNKKWELSYAAIENDTLAGFMLVSDKGENHHLHRIVIAEKFQNKKIGKTMLLKLIENARSRHKNSVTLKVHQTNAGAIKFYEGLGFKETAKEIENHLYTLVLK